MPVKRTTFVIDTDRTVLDVIASEVSMDTHADKALEVLRRAAVGVTPVLELADVTFRRDGKQIIDGISLTVHAGEHWALLGPNGAGKSTLLGFCAAVTFPTSGTVQHPRRADGPRRPGAAAPFDRPRESAAPPAILADRARSGAHRHHRHDRHPDALDADAPTNSAAPTR